MRALEFHGPRDLRLVSRPELTIPVGQQVLFRPTLAGICGTDRAIYLGHYDCTPPRVLGHEAVGVVEAVGDDVEGLRPRDRVILDPTQSCGACRRCVRGETSHCVNKGPLEIGVGRDGAFRQGMLIEARALHRLRDDMSDRHAVLIEPLACVLNALDKSGAAAGDRVTVIGGGPMGVLAAQVAQRRSAMVEVVEIDPYRRALLERLAGVSIIDKLVAHDGEPSATLVVDTTGTQCVEAIEYVEDGGRVCLIGCNTDAVINIRSFDLTGRCVSLIGSCDYHSSMFPVAMEYMRSLDCERLVTDVVPIESYAEAFDLLAAGSSSSYRAGKVVLALT